MENWRKIVEVVPDEVELALEVLALELGLEENTFKGVDLNALKDAEYITAVPIELALTADDRETIMRSNPNIRFVITRVQSDRVSIMVSELGYELIAVDDYLEDIEEDDEIEEPVEILDADSYYQVGSTTAKGSEIYELLEENPTVNIYDNSDEESYKACDDLEDKSESSEKCQESFKINDKEVSREEFLDKVPYFLKEFLNF